MNGVTFDKCSESSQLLRDVSRDIWPEHRGQRINVLISVKCFAHMFPNTHSWYHSRSACPEEAVSYRCQYPRWPLSLPPAPPHTWHWRIVPQNKGTGGFCGEQATKHSCHNGESGRQVQLVHTLKRGLCKTPLCLKTKLELHSPLGCLVTAPSPWQCCILREFLLLSALLLPCCPRRKPLQGHCRADTLPDWWLPHLLKNLKTSFFFSFGRKICRCLLSYLTWFFFPLSTSYDSFSIKPWTYTYTTELSTLCSLKNVASIHCYAMVLFVMLRNCFFPAMFIYIQHFYPNRLTLE